MTKVFLREGILITLIQDTPQEDEGPYLGYYDFKELDFSEARSKPKAVMTDDLGLMVDDRYRKVQGRSNLFQGKIEGRAGGCDPGIG